MNEQELQALLARVAALETKMPSLKASSGSLKRRWIR